MSVRESATTVAARPEDKWLGIGPSIVYGMQHILSMFGGVIAVPIIVGGAAWGGQPDAGVKTGILIASALFISGIATVLQTLGLPYFGSQLPLVQGISFGSVSTLIAIVAGKGNAGMEVAFGACIAAGVAALIIVPFFAQVIRFFPDVVTGSVISVIGLSLMPVAGKWITGQPTINQGGQMVPNQDFGNPTALALGMLTLALVLVMSTIKGMSRMAILLGLVVGTALSPLFGLFKAPALAGISPVALPMPFAFGLPQFEIGAIISMFIVLIVIMVETTADILAIGVVVGTKVDSKRVADGLRADMLSCVVAPVFNTFPATAFAQNVGLVALSGIKSRYAVAVGGVILAVLGLSPWLAAVIGVIPLPVLGGVGIALFGSVAASGIRTLANVKYDGNNNLLIVAVSIGFGLLPVMVPGFWHKLPASVAVILDSGISSAAIAAFLLNLIFNHLIGREPEVHWSEGHSPARAVGDGFDEPVADGMPEGIPHGQADATLRESLDKAADKLDGNK